MSDRRGRNCSCTPGTVNAAGEIATAALAGAKNGKSQVLSYTVSLYRLNLHSEVSASRKMKRRCGQSGATIGVDQTHGRRITLANWRVPVSTAHIVVQS